MTALGWDTPAVTATVTVAAGALLGMCHMGQLLLLLRLVLADQSSEPRLQGPDGYFL